MFWRILKRHKYKCPKCGLEHDELPAIGFDEPYYFSILSNKEKAEITELSSDFCIIRHHDQTDRFIRAFLTIQVNDACEDLDYGIWVSVSEKTFNQYEAEFDNPSETRSYFGRISNEIKDYEQSTLGIHVNIETRLDGNRPELIPHESDHPLVAEWKSGITFIEAESRVNKLSRQDG